MVMGMSLNSPAYRLKLALEYLEKISRMKEGRHFFTNWEISQQEILKAIEDEN